MMSHIRPAVMKKKQTCVDHILSLPAGKAFDITYVRLKFHTSRPESFAIYKRTREGGPWVPYQYYSGSCEKTYQKVNHGFIRSGEDEQQALCTDDFSDISPLTGGNVAFSTLESRPSAYNFDNSPVLQVSQYNVPPRIAARTCVCVYVSVCFDEIYFLFPVCCCSSHSRCPDVFRNTPVCFSPSIPFCRSGLLLHVARQRPVQ